MAKGTQYSSFHVNISASGYKFRFIFRSLSTIPYSDESRMINALSVLKDGPALREIMKFCSIKRFSPNFTYKARKRKNTYFQIYLPRSIPYLLSYVPFSSLQKQSYTSTSFKINGKTVVKCIFGQRCIRFPITY